MVTRVGAYHMAGESVDGERELLLALRCVRALAALCAVWTLGTLAGQLVGFGPAVVPGLVRAEQLSALERVMDIDARTLVEASYGAPNSSGVRCFCGNPCQLHARSALAVAMGEAARGEGEAPGEALIDFAREESQALGLDSLGLRRESLWRSCEELLGCVAVFWLASVAVSRGRG